MSRDFYKIEAKTALFCEKFHNTTAKYFL